MFKGKIYVYKNNNGKEEEFEKEFDNPQEFVKFQHKYHQPEIEGPFMGLGDRAHLQNYFNNLIDRRFGLGNSYEEPESENEGYLPNGINLNTYEEELQKLEYEKNHKAEKIQGLKDTLSKLKDYKKKFKAEGRDDMIEKLDADINQVQAELDTLEK